MMFMVAQLFQRMKPEIGHGIAPGHLVSRCAESFVAATRTRYTLRRDDARAGAVRVHFPRVGCVLKPEITS